MNELSFLHLEFESMCYNVEIFIRCKNSFKNAGNVVFK